MKTRSMSTRIGIVALLLTACGGEGGLHAQASQAREQVRERLGPISAIDTATAFRLSNTFRAAADRALPAVVFISVLSEGRQPAMQQEIPEELRRMLPPGMFRMPDNADPTPQRGTGSGFIIDARGHIMTNHHVVTGASQIVVRMVDGREYEARLVGSDANTDVAILKIEPRAGETLPVAELGSSDEARIGDWVIALGNPLGLEFSVTAGIVSAKGRQLRRSESLAGTNAPPLEAYIQTDAAINPGNSGGPLVDLFGRVIAMNTAISAQSFIGHGFAVPIDLARRVASDLMEHGYVRRPRIGVTVADVQQVDAEAYRLPRIAGAHVTSVQEGQPGARAGLRVGDVVTAIDGRSIENAGDLTTTLARMQPGDVATFTIWRDARQQTLRVTLGEFARTEAVAPVAGAAPRAADRIGFTVTAITAEEAARLGLPREGGLLISEVVPFGPAAGRVTAPRAPGVPMLLRSINGRAVRTPQEFETAVRELNAGEVVRLRVVQPEIGETAINYRLR